MASSKSPQTSNTIAQTSTTTKRQTHASDKQEETHTHTASNIFPSTVNLDSQHSKLPVLSLLLNHAQTSCLSFHSDRVSPSRSSYAIPALRRLCLSSWSLSLSSFCMVSPPSLRSLCLSVCVTCLTISSVSPSRSFLLPVLSVTLAGSFVIFASLSFSSLWTRSVHMVNATPLAPPSRPHRPRILSSRRLAWTLPPLPLLLDLFALLAASFFVCFRPFHLCSTPLLGPLH